MSESRARITPLTIVLLLVAAALIVVGVLYLTLNATDLPGFMPGKPDYDPVSDRKFTKRGVAAIGAGVVALVAAWYTSGLRNKVLPKR